MTKPKTTSWAGRTIHVTKEDIESGIRCHTTLCAISQAIKRSSGAEVFTDACRCYIGDESYRLPNAARDWAYRFDNGDLVKPFSFKVGARHED